MGITEFDSTPESEQGTSASSDSKLPEVFCTFNFVESATTGTIGIQYLESDFFPPQQTIPMEKSGQISSRDFLKQT
jgi:hypothetical protein